jgi:hypothetical protein
VLGQSSAIVKRPPHGNSAQNDGSADYLRVQDPVAIGAGSSAAIATLAEGIPIAGCWVTFSVDTDCFIHFGPDATLAAASSTNSWPMRANTEKEFWVSEKDAFFRIIQATTSGTLYRYRSNL